MKTVEQFEKWAEKQEAKGKHPIDSLLRAKDLDDWKEDFGVDKKSEMCCPLCTAGFNRGKLYESTEVPNVYVCGNCSERMKIKVITPGTVFSALEEPE